MNKENIKLLYRSFDFKGKISFLFNSLQSVFADLFYGVIYFLIFEKLVKGKISLLSIFLIIGFVFVYFIFLVPFWGYCMERCRNIYFKNFSNIVFEKVFKYIGKAHSSEIVYLLQNDVNQCSNMASWSLVVLFQSIFSGIVSSIIIGRASLFIVLLLYALGIMPVFIDIVFSKYIKNKYAILRENIEHFRKNITEYSNNIIISKIYNISDEIEKDLLNSVYCLYKNELKLKTYGLLIEIINKLIYNFAFKFIIIVYGMKLVVDGKVSFGYFALSISMVEGIIFFLSYIGYYIKNLQKMLLSFDKVNKFLNYKDRNKNNIFNENEISEILFENVSFSYGDSRKILDNFNLKLKFPNNYLITGKNGKGKSTIFKLIFGYLNCNKGSIEFKYRENKNTQPIYVSQETLIFEGNLYDNLCLDEKFSTEEIKKALHCVKLDEWIQDTNYLENFKIENNGENISKGQKMRLTIANALLRNPQILFLDEPDSNLDKNTILEVFNLIKNNYSCNLVIITHKKENFDLDRFKLIEI